MFNGRDVWDIDRPGRGKVMVDAHWRNYDKASKIAVDHLRAIVQLSTAPIVSGLPRLPDRKLSQAKVQRDISLLFKGVA